MAKIKLRACHKYESDSDSIEIPINNQNFLRIFRIYGHTEDSIRWEKIQVEHMKQRDDCETWESISQTEYVIKQKGTTMTDNVINIKRKKKELERRDRDWET